MSWRTSSVVLGLRDAARAFGINRWLSKIRAENRYEARYEAGIMASIRPGECVWDIGANIGRYTRTFAERVGAQGMVVAFEPSPANFARLAVQCSSMPNVRLLQLGLGNENHRLRLEQGPDELGATSRIVEGRSDGIDVQIRTGDDLVASGAAAAPQAIKIDVEGYEKEVLEGMPHVLSSPRLRLIGVEVHFGILSRRGMGHAPRDIERLLRSRGFSVTWTDSSHIVARRNG